MEDSIFTKIINGEIPATKIYEDSKVLAFLDLFPKSAGHTLLIPKQQTDKIYDLDDETYLYLWKIAKKLAKNMDEKTGQRTIIKVVGTDVPHAHIHLIPYDPNYDPQKKEEKATDEYMQKWQKILEVK